MEVPAEALLVGVAGDADHHGVLELADAEELLAGCLAAELVFSVVQVRQILDLGHGQAAQVAGADGHAQDALFVQQGVEDPPDASLLRQVCGHVVHAALLRDVLSEDPHAGVLHQQVTDGPVELHGHVPRTFIVFG